MLNIAVKAARRAGVIINRAAQDIDALTVSTKRHNDFVTEVDQAAEQAAIQILLKAFPDHAILAEESGAHGKSDYVWIIDPLDGTTNFIHGFPQYCVSIGLQHKGVVTQAVVFDPGRNELFTATRRARGLPQRPAHARIQTHAVGRFPHRHWLSVSRIQTPERIHRHIAQSDGADRRRAPRPAPPRSISPMSPQAGWTASGRSVSRPGTWRPAAC